MKGLTEAKREEGLWVSGRMVFGLLGFRVSGLEVQGGVLGGLGVKGAGFKGRDGHVGLAFGVGISWAPWGCEISDLGPKP